MGDIIYCFHIVTVQDRICSIVAHKIKKKFQSKSPFDNKNNVEQDRLLH